MQAVVQRTPEPLSPSSTSGSMVNLELRVALSHHLVSLALEMIDSYNL